MSPRHLSCPPPQPPRLQPAQPLRRLPSVTPPKRGHRIRQLSTPRRRQSCLQSHTTIITSSVMLSTVIPHRDTVKYTVTMLLPSVPSMLPKTPTIPPVISSSPFPAAILTKVELFHPTANQLYNIRTQLIIYSAVRSIITYYHRLARLLALRLYRHSSQSNRTKEMA